ncbi:MAG: NAD(P)-dependent oxidoreductase [Candidatus Lokiarchaeota archaeon]|nr:NAD(P)-dependent oxidoreductase [Candidatus Lokiarchaeota archaeon]
MKQKVLLTGAFGNVGQNALKQLLKREHQVICFDLKNKENQNSCKELSKRLQFKTIWGDITNQEDVNNAVNGMDCIVHLAAIIPPLSEKNPELARKVNIEGTRNLINAAKVLPNKPKFIMASSASVFGVTMDLNPPTTVNTPLNPSDHYSHTKVECEIMLRNSGLPWLILRLAAVSVDKLPNTFDTLLYEMPLEQRIEFVSSKDCGIAFANAVFFEEVDKIFLIGGGEGCQLYQRDFLTGVFDAFGLKMLPDDCFKVPTKKEDWFYIDWMDTKNSQDALKFQTVTFEQYVEGMKRNSKMKRLGMKILGPLAKRTLIKMSPYNKSE